MLENCGFMDYIGPFIGIAGILIGITISEFLRRKSRIELYIPSVFDRRLRKYEEFSRKVDESVLIIETIEKDQSLKGDKALDIVSAAIMNVLEYTDENKLYINDAIIVHCGAMFMGVEVINEVDESERGKLLEKYHSNVTEAKRMIKELSGIHAVETLIEKLNKAELSGPIIDYYNKIKKESEKKNKK